MRAIVAIAMLLTSSTAFAGCEFSTSPCYTDGRGNTYRTEQNLGGGYNTYRNGTLNSQASQGLSGSWTERSRDGGVLRRYDHDPYSNRYGD